MVPLSKSLVGVVIAAMFSVTVASSASALKFVFGPEGEFSNMPPTTLSGEVVVTIDDGPGDDTVTVTVDATDLDGSLSEFISGLYLNIEDDSFGDLTFDDVATNPSPDADAEKFNSANIVSGSATYSGAANAFMADGDGNYDIRIDWGSNEFTAGDTDVFEITDADSNLAMVDFDALSQPAGGHGPFTAVLRVQGLGDDGEGSGFFAPIPEPSTITLLGIGLVGLAGYGWRRRRGQPQN